MACVDSTTTLVFMVLDLCNGCARGVPCRRSIARARCQAQPVYYPWMTEPVKYYPPPCNNNTTDLLLYTRVVSRYSSFGFEHVLGNPMQPQTTPGSPGSSSLPGPRRVTAVACQGNLQVPDPAFLFVVVVVAGHAGSQISPIR